MLYQLTPAAIDETIPAGRYLLDAGPELPRTTVQVDSEASREEFFRRLGSKLGLTDERIEEMLAEVGEPSESDGRGIGKALREFLGLA